MEHGPTQSLETEPLRFELEVLPLTADHPWRARLRFCDGTSPAALQTAEFDSPLALMRFLAHLNARLAGTPRTAGLR